MVKKAGMREKYQMGLNIVNAIWKRSFEFSEFTDEAKKCEGRPDLDDVQSLLVSYGLSKSRQIFFSKSCLWGRWYYVLYSTIYYDVSKSCTPSITPSVFVKRVSWIFSMSGWDGKIDLNVYFIRTPRIYFIKCLLHSDFIIGCQETSNIVHNFNQILDA